MLLMLGRFLPVTRDIEILPFHELQLILLHIDLWLLERPVVVLMENTADFSCLLEVGLWVRPPQRLGPKLLGILDTHGDLIEPWHLLFPS